MLQKDLVLILAIAMILNDGHSIDQDALPIQMGEEVDFKRLFRLYYAPLRYYCKQLTNDSDGCDDIVSHLFLKLWTKQVHFESKGHAQAYLYRSAKNACLDLIRNDKTAVERKEALSQATTEISEDYLEVIINNEVWSEVYRAINSLPLQCGKVITMSYLEGMSNQEIADEMGLTQQVVKNYKLRGLNLLKDRLPDSMLVIFFAGILFK